MSSLGELRGGVRQTVTVTVTVDVEDAIAQLMAVFLTSVNGVPAKRLFEDPFPVRGQRLLSCGRRPIRLSAADLSASADAGLPSPRLSPVTSTLCRRDRPLGRLRIGGRDQRGGGTCVAVRTRAEWCSHPQGLYLADRPLIEITRIGDTPPLPLPEGKAALPMDGLRVLDNTHVIAGPIAARLMAEHGAEVLHLSTPRYPDPQAMQIETNIGKRSAWCDLDEPAGRAAFERVMSDADIYVSSYLSLDRKGYGPLALAERRPGIVVLDFHGWGKAGPWSQRGGFDQLACAATGFSAEEGAFDGPRLPPPDLARLKDRCVSVLGPFGETTYLPTRINYSDIRPSLARGAEPLGASACAWASNSG
ncbi:CoA transferase [Granulibacter bethesdensis]|nr:CoA transferase [Granulibacter bethesdensis]